MKATKKINAMVKGIKINPEDNKNVEFVEIDRLMQLYIEVYK